MLSTEAKVSRDMESADQGKSAELDFTRFDPCAHETTVTKMHKYRPPRENIFTVHLSDKDIDPGYAKNPCMSRAKSRTTQKMTRVDMVSDSSKEPKLSNGEEKVFLTKYWQK